MGKQQRNRQSGEPAVSGGLLDALRAGGTAVAEAEDQREAPAATSDPAADAPPAPAPPEEAAPGTAVAVAPPPRWMQELHLYEVSVPEFFRSSHWAPNEDAAIMLYLDRWRLRSTPQKPVVRRVA